MSRRDRNARLFRQEIWDYQGSLRHAFKVTFAKKPKLIPLNMEILEAGAQAVMVLEMVAKR